VSIPATPKTVSREPVSPARLLLTSSNFAMSPSFPVESMPVL
jgi:hypothetical protein